MFIKNIIEIMVKEIKLLIYIIVKCKIFPKVGLKDQPPINVNLTMEVSLPPTTPTTQTKKQTDIFVACLKHCN